MNPPARREPPSHASTAKLEAHKRHGCTASASQNSNDTTRALGAQIRLANTSVREWLSESGCRNGTRATHLIRFLRPNRGEAEVNMIYGSFNRTSVPEKVAKLFPRNQEFGYELINLRLQIVCDTMQDRDSVYSQAKDAHLYVAMLGPRITKNHNWYGIYW